LHLLGYDHADADEHATMFGLQEQTLASWRAFRERPVPDGRGPGRGPEQAPERGPERGPERAERERHEGAG
jgi:hypothetical protein